MVEWYTTTHFFLTPETPDPPPQTLNLHGVRQLHTRHSFLSVILCEGRQTCISHHNLFIALCDSLHRAGQVDRHAYPTTTYSLCCVTACTEQGRSTDMHIPPQLIHCAVWQPAPSRAGRPTCISHHNLFIALCNSYIPYIASLVQSCEKIKLLFK